MGVTSVNFGGPFQTPNVQVWPDGGETFYVGTSLPQGLGEKIGDRFFTSVNAAWNAVSANRYDTIAVLPGYTELVATANQWSNIKAGARVLGLGSKTVRPKFTWTAANATLLLSAANVTIQDCQFELAGQLSNNPALTVANGLNITGIGCKLVNNHFQCGFDADQIMTLGVLVNAAKCEILSNKFIGNVAGPITAAGTVLRLSAADEVVIDGNYFSAATTTITDGLIESLTTASLNIQITNNYIFSSGATSTCAFDFGAALACTGFVDYNLARVSADGTAMSVIYTISASNNLTLGKNNFGVNNINEQPFAAAAGALST